MKHAAVTIMRKKGQSLLALLASLVLLNLLSHTHAGAVDSVVLAQSPPATPQYSDWSAPVNLGPNINTASNDLQEAITHQGLSLYFSSPRPGGFGKADIYVSRRPSLDAPWGPAQNLGPTVNSPSGEWAQSFSSDDHWMYLTSDRPGFGGLDIWVSYRADTNDDFGWEAPKNLGPSVNTSADEADPFYFIDPATGKPTLYLTSTRPGGVGDNDIYQSTQNEDGSFNTPVLVPELSSPYFDGRMTVRYDGLEIIFSSDRPGVGARDQWFSTRQTTGDVWSTPVNLGPVVNSSSADLAPSLSADGETLFFSSGRKGGFGNFDLWMTTRTKLPFVKTKDITVEANDSCTASISPGDVDDGSFDPDSGDTITLSLDQAGPFGLGQYIVTLTATDNHGASSSSSATVTVVDQTPPTITAPIAVTIATGPSATSCGAFISDAVLGAATTNDNCSVTITRAGVPVGNFFPIGTTVITYVATDGGGNTASATQSVIVIDDTPPKITAPPAVTIATGPGATSCGAFISDAVLGIALASDNCSVTIARSGVPADNFFPIGTTTISYLATDGSDNTAFSTQSVTVIDDTPPVIVGAAVDKPTLWPPNHQMVDVAVGYTATDNCGAVDTTLGVSSNEPVNGPGDGDSGPDWEILDAHHVRLRAERSGQGSGRIYTINITASDSHGNTSNQTVSVSVPHN